MSIKHDIQHYKTLFNQAVDLLLLRLQLLQLDMVQQTRSLIRLIVVALLCAVFLLIALLSVLFGLNHVLPDHIKTVVFFGISGLLLVLMVLLWRQAWRNWQHNSQQIGQTLADMQQDMAYLRGQQPQDSRHD